MQSSPGAGVGPFRPRGIGDLLSAAFELYGKYWQALMGMAAIIIVPLTFVQALITDQLFEETNVVINQQTGTVSVSSSGFGRTVFITLIVALIGALAQQVLTGAVTRAAAGSLVGEVPSSSEAFQYGFSKLGSILWIGLLVALAVAGGFILLVIPGLIFLVKLAVSLPALVVEDQRGTQAMSRSWNLTTGSFWHVVGTVVVAYIIVAVASSILGAIGGSSWVLSWIMSSIAQILTIPFLALVTVLVYIDLRVRKEAYTAEGLRMDLQAPGAGGTGGPAGGFGGAPPPPPPTPGA